MMNRIVLEEFLIESGWTVMLADGFDYAFVGVTESIDCKPKACYDKEKCIKILQSENDWTYVEAVEYFDYNVIGAYVGENTPTFLQPIEGK